VVVEGILEILGELDQPAQLGLLVLELLDILGELDQLAQRAQLDHMDMV
jgi:hypothetical protein